MRSTPIHRLLAAMLVAAATPAAAVTVTRGPYLQTPTATSMTLRWRTDTATTSQVSYGAAPGSLSATASDPIPTTEHVVTVTSLTADTQYYYAIGSAGGALLGDDADHWFRTAPTTGTAKPLRIWTIGDAGFTGPNLDAVRDAFAAFNGSSATDLFVLLGDNAYLLGTDAQYQAAVFAEHAAMLRTTPVYSVFGNHEAFSSSSLTQTGPYFDMFSFPMAAEAGGMASGTEAYFSFDWGSVHFIVLDSEQAPASSSTPMLTWLEADLQATTAEWVIALWHRPPYSRGLFHDSDVEVAEINMRQYALPILESYGVDLVLNGHSHNYERSGFLDGHYGLANTFSAANRRDPGDGDPAGDGAYRKPLGLTPNAGAVYVVNGSGSEVRNSTLNHPAMVVNLLELGSVVVDVDGDTLTARMLNSAGLVRDTFRIVKGGPCPATPAGGCVAAGKSRFSLRTNADAAKNKWGWTWQKGDLATAGLGDPTSQTDLAVCVYDAAGLLVGGSVPAAAAEWKAKGSGFGYSDKLAARDGLRKILTKIGAAPKGRIVAKAKGAAVGTPATPATFPLTAQLVNRDSGACWQSSFTSFAKNEAGKVTAVVK